MLARLMTSNVTQGHQKLRSSTGHILLFNGGL